LLHPGLPRRDIATRSAADPLPPAKAVQPFPMEARLSANLYQQTAAEYQACCLTIYKSAQLRLETILQTARPRPARPAIVMDLDETVLDNSKFESFLYKYRLEYTEALWDVYEGGYPKDVSLVPGAKHFIEWAEGHGVTVVYISNRSEPFRASTLAALRGNGLNVADINDRLYLKERRH
jgi:5'-nucleotidase (lipoprotein e(P4) family)